MNVLIINNHSRFIPNLLKILNRLNFKSQIINYSKLNPSLANRFDFFILSGGTINITQNKFLEQEKKLITETKKPLFGICCGFEIISLLHGGKLTKLKNKKRGVKTVRLVSNIFGENKLKVFASHEYVIRNKLKEFKILATSINGIEIIQHRSKPIIATQFHPEVIKNNDGKKVLEYFIKNIALKKVIQ